MNKTGFNYIVINFWVSKVIVFNIFLCFFTSIFFLSSFFRIEVLAMSIEDYDFSEIEKFLEQDEDTSGMNFMQLLTDIMSTEIVEVQDNMIDKVLTVVFDEFQKNKKSLVAVVMLALISAVFVSFSSAFDSGQVPKTAIFITRIVIVSVLMNGFKIIMSIIQVFMLRLVELMNALLPVYVFSVTFSTGTATAVALRQSAMIVMALVERCVLTILVPAIQVYVIMMLVNSVVGANGFGKMCRLVKTFVLWLNRTILAFVGGLNVVKNMVAPYADQAANTAFNKAISFIPGIGSGIGGVSEIVMGTGKFIRNSIGVAGLIIILVICLIPVVKMLVFSVMYKLCGALIEPIADSKVVEEISVVGEGVELLIKVSLTGALMFMLTIGMVCM